MSINLVMTTDSLRPPLTGIGYYTASLLNELLLSPEMGDINGLSRQGLSTRHQLTNQLAGLSKQPPPPDGNDSNPFPGRIAPLAKGISSFFPALATGIRRYSRHRLSRRLRERPDYLLHAPDFIPPDFSGRTVVTVHDLSHIRFPDTHPKHRVRWLNSELPKALDRADRIICVSDFTRREIVELGLVNDDSKLRVCLNGVDGNFKPRGKEEIRQTLALWGLQSRGYILSVATLEPRKNLATLIEAYGALPAEIAAEFPLVLAGGEGWKSRELRDRISRLPSPYKVLATGYVDTGTLQHLLCGASLFAYGSLYEGFGLPVLEAMASDTPVLISNAEALKEVAGEAGYVINSGNTNALTEGILELLENHLLSRQLRQKGLQRAEEFSWEKCADETVAVYNELL